MLYSNNGRVDQFIADTRDVSQEKFEVLSAVRALFFEASGDLSEGIKYGGLIFERDNQLIGGVFIYKNHASLEFSEGARFEDPHTVLEGKGKYRRHIKLVSTGDVEEKHCADYIKQALT